MTAANSEFQIGFEEDDGFTADEVRTPEVQTMSIVGDGNEQPLTPAVEAVLDVGLIDGTTSSTFTGEQGLVVPPGAQTEDIIDCRYFGRYSDGALVVEGTSTGFRVSHTGQFGFRTVNVRTARSDVNTIVNNYSMGTGAYGTSNQLRVASSDTDTTATESYLYNASSGSTINMYWRGGNNPTRRVDEFWLQFYDGINSVEIPMRQGAFWVDPSRGNSDQLSLLINSDNTDDYTSYPWLEGWNQTGFTGNGGTNPANAAAYALRTYFPAVSGAVALHEYSTKINWLQSSGYLVGSSLFINGVNQNVTVTSIANATTRTSSISGFVFGGIFATFSANISKTSLILVDNTDLVDNFSFNTPTALPAQIGANFNGITPITSLMIENIDIDIPHIKWDNNLRTGTFAANLDEAGTMSALRNFVLDHYTNGANLAPGVVDTDPISIATYNAGSPDQTTSNGVTYNILQVDTGAYGDTGTPRFSIEDSNGIEYGFARVTTVGAASGVSGSGTIVRLIDPDGTTLRGTFTTENNGAPQLGDYIRGLSLPGWTTSGSGGQVIFTANANGPQTGQWSITIDNQGVTDNPGTLSFVLEETTSGVAEVDAVLNFSWTGETVGNLTISNTEVITSDTLTSRVVTHLEGATGTNWVFSRADSVITANARVAGPSRTVDLFIGSNQGNFITSQFSYNQSLGVTAAAAETFTVGYSNPTGTNPGTRTFTGPQTFAQIFNRIRDDIGGASDWSAAGIANDGVISVTRNAIGPVTGVWELNISLL